MVRYGTTWSLLAAIFQTHVSFGIQFDFLNYTKYLMNLSHLLPVLLVFGLLTAQPIPKNDWQSIRLRPRDSDTSYPRVAAFRNGEYAVIYGVVNETLHKHIAVQIFHPNGTLSVPERIFPSNLGDAFAPNIMVVGDMAVAVWRHLQSPILSNLHFYSSGSISVHYESVVALDEANTQDIYELFSVDSTIYGITLSPSLSATTLVVLLHSTRSFTETPSYLLPYPATAAPLNEIPSVVCDPRTNKTFIFESTTETSIFNAYGGTRGGPRLQQVFVSPPHKYYPFLVANTALLPAICRDTSRSVISLVVWDQDLANKLYERDLFNITFTGRRPDVLHLGSNYVLVAHTGDRGYLQYRYIRLNPMSVDFVGPVITDFSRPTDGASMAIIGKDIVVTTYGYIRSQIMTRVLTFCGNGFVDFNEECDGSIGCTSQCTCQIGTSASNGLCENSCGNGVVSGDEDCDSSEGCDPTTCKCQAGFLPSVLQKRCIPTPADFVPKVGPSLDCLIKTGDTLQLFFSFVSTDPFDQIIEYGEMNTFIPNELATNRPTFFKSGTTLTYPVSPYNLTVYTSIGQFTWLLGSYNLTVDLSGDKADALQCPKNAGFVMTVTTFDTLNDADVRLLLVNMAAKYNISIDRLEATYRLSAAGTVPEPNIYSVSVTILSSMDPLDPAAQEVVKELYNDLVVMKEDLVSDLTQGLEEKNPQIKDVTPVPTGVEVRGEERDFTPSAVFVPEALMSVSSDSSSFCTLVSLMVLILSLQ